MKNIGCENDSAAPIPEMTNGFLKNSAISVGKLSDGDT